MSRRPLFVIAPTVLKTLYSFKLNLSQCNASSPLNNRLCSRKEVYTAFKIQRQIAAKNKRCIESWSLHNGSMTDMCQIVIISLPPPPCGVGSLRQSHLYSTVTQSVCPARLVRVCCAWFTEWDVFFFFLDRAAGTTSPCFCQQHKAGHITLLQHVSLQNRYECEPAASQWDALVSGAQAARMKTTAPCAWMCACLRVCVGPIVPVFLCGHIFMFPLLPARLCISLKSLHLRSDI